MESKLRRTQNELEDVTRTVVDSADGSNSNTAELISLRKIRYESEHKIAELLDELDDAAGNVEQLQKSVTQLTMAAERTRCEHMREIERFEGEMDEQRAQHQRRVSPYVHLSTK